MKPGRTQPHAMTDPQHTPRPSQGSRPSYVEAAPLGPTDAGDAGGPAQLGTAYVRRFTAPLSDGSHYGVVDVQTMVVNAETDPDKPPTPVLSRTYGFTACTDPADPLGTEISSDTAYDPDIPTHPDRPPLTSTDAYWLCATFDPSRITWDGEEDPDAPSLPTHDKPVPVITNPNLVLIEYLDDGPDEEGRRTFFAYWLDHIGPDLRQPGTRGQIFCADPTTVDPDNPRRIIREWTRPST